VWRELVIGKLVHVAARISNRSFLLNYRDIPGRMTRIDQGAKKSKKCSLHAARALPRANSDKMIQRVSNLERIDDIPFLIGLMVGEEKRFY
jgi:hypothetical protein